jgi:hypothetical protein
VSKENILSRTFRLNMDNPKQAKLNEILNNLNPDKYRSINQFLVEAALFYMEHSGEAPVTKTGNAEESPFLRREDFEALKSELTECARQETRKELLGLLGGMIAGMQAPLTMREVPVRKMPEPQEESEEDEVVAGYARNWMMGGET